MAGYSAIPRSTRLAIEGYEFLDGDVMLRAGAGLIGESTPGERLLQLDARVHDTMQPAAFFLPGEMVAGSELLRFKQIRSTQETRLRLMELNCRVAPVGVSASDYRALVVRGSVSGSQTLPLSSATRHFAFNDIVAALIAPTGSTSGSDLAKDSTAVGTWVTLDAPLSNVQGFTFRMGKNSAPADQNTGRRRVAEILDADLNVLGRGVTTKMYDNVGSSGFIANPYLLELDRAVSLPAGEPLLFAVRAGEPLVVTAGALPVFYQGANTAEQTPVTVDGFPSPVWKVPASSHNDDASWAELRSAGLVMPESLASAGGIGVNIYGAPDSPLISGDVIFDVTTVGTGGTAGAIDTNVRLVWELVE